MRFDGQIFDGARSLYYSDWHLHILTGSARWFPEFTPIDLVALNYVRATKGIF